MIKESKGNMYEFVTHTWNPIKGKCSHGCTYCYMKKMCSRLNTPRLDAAELTCYLECSNFIFVGSSIDMWAEDIPSHWIKWFWTIVIGLPINICFKAKILPEY